MLEGYRAIVMSRERTKAREPGSWIGALYRRMSSWYIVFSIILALVILLVGYHLTRPLLPLFFGDRPRG